jgi:regulator of sirC expression with transglutaminase-like and TPR domain
LLAEEWVLVPSRLPALNPTYVPNVDPIDIARGGLQSILFRLRLLLGRSSSLPFIRLLGLVHVILPFLFSERISESERFSLYSPFAVRRVYCLSLKWRASILKSHRLPLSEEFIAYKNEDASVISGAILVGRTLDADLDRIWVLRQIERLATDITVSDGVTLLDALLILLRDTGFRGASDYYQYSNSNIEAVLKTFTGIPISLAVLLMSLADELGLSNEGINFPGHFLVTIDEQLVDPFTMRLVRGSTLKNWLEHMSISRDEALRSASPCQIVMRMLNNLKALAVTRMDFSKALDFSGYQLLVADDLFSLYLERAELWTKLAVPTMAIKELELALSLAPNDEAIFAVKKKIETLPGTSSKLH